MKLRFWGTRGNIATPGAHTVELGGNTTCLEVQLQKRRSLMLDCGSGLIAYASSLMNRGEAKSEPPIERHFHLLVTHFHWDHVLGFPFFHPLHVPSSRVHLYSAFPAEQLEDVFRSLFDGTYSPLRDLDNLAAEVTFHQIPEAGISLEGARITHHPVDHSEDNYAYRIEHEGKALAFATDHEARDRPRNVEVCDFVKGADLLVHDAQWTAEEYPKHVGWGHSTIEAAIDNGVAAGVRQLLLTHHAPHHSDDFLRVYLSRVLRKLDLAALAPRVELAREGVHYDV